MNDVPVGGFDHICRNWAASVTLKLSLKHQQKSSSPIHNVRCPHHKEQAMGFISGERKVLLRNHLMPNQTLRQRVGHFSIVISDARCRSTNLALVGNKHMKLNFTKGRRCVRHTDHSRYHLRSAHKTLLRRASACQCYTTAQPRLIGRLRAVRDYISTD